MKIPRGLKFEVPVIIEKDGEEFYAHSPFLKGLHTCGSTIDELKTNAANAIIAYIESLIMHGDPIPLGIMKSDDRPAPVCPDLSQADLIQVAI